MSVRTTNQPVAPFPVVFCLASGRSGTHFLYQLLRRNTHGVVCRHEPYVWNPSMFGRCIYDHASHDEAGLRRVAERKRRVIQRLTRTAGYVETSHAFLKSWAELAAEYFPHLKLVHLVRNPLSVAKSEALREAMIRRWRMPLATYRGGDGKSYFRWALTGKEPIFRQFQGLALSRFQWYVIQWIEIENRALSFLQRHGKQGDCFTLHSPVELNDARQVESLLEFLKLPRRSQNLILKGRKNRTPGSPLQVTPREREEFAEVVARLPSDYLAIFRQHPYSQWDWANLLSPLP